MAKQLVILRPTRINCFRHETKDSSGRIFSQARAFLKGDVVEVQSPDDFNALLREGMADPFDPKKHKMQLPLDDDAPGSPYTPKLTVAEPARGTAK